MEITAKIVKSSAKGENATNFGRSLGIARSSVATISKDKGCILKHVKGSAPMISTPLVPSGKVVWSLVQHGNSERNTSITPSLLDPSTSTLIRAATMTDQLPNQSMKKKSTSKLSKAQSLQKLPGDDHTSPIRNAGKEETSKRPLELSKNRSRNQTCISMHTTLQKTDVSKNCYSSRGVNGEPLVKEMDATNSGISLLRKRTEDNYKEAKNLSLNVQVNKIAKQDSKSAKLSLQYASSKRSISQKPLGASAPSPLVIKFYSNLDQHLSIPKVSVNLQSTSQANHVGCTMQETPEKAKHSQEVLSEDQSFKEAGTQTSWPNKGFPSQESYCDTWQSVEKETKELKIKNILLERKLDSIKTTFKNKQQLMKIREFINSKDDISKLQDIITELNDI
ncbi:hypothetical protein SK128_010991 [Halocaridina rubra]|uniref:Uncharacterized protein n=1 Tax=Halocaridina rubra TaxID=373956 RepID=A0AAN9AFP3_HALRR